MTVCRVCVLDERFPHADIDAAGLCSYCRAAASRGDQKAALAGPGRAFDEYLESARSRPDSYQAVAAFSGGKDSAHLLWTLTRKYRLKTLAFTLDNGFLAERTKRNIACVLDALGADHVMIRPPGPLIAKLFAGSSLDPGIHPAKALERSSAACASCIGLVKAAGLKLASSRKIPLLCFGWTPGQSSAAASFIRFEAVMLLEFQRATRGVLEKISGCDLSAWFVTPEELSAPGGNPAWAYPAAFQKYDERKIYRTIRSLGWKKPSGLDPNSTNCRFNSVAIADHLNRFGFHPYAFELAKLVREGYLSRSDALLRLRWRPSAAMIRRVRADLKSLSGGS